MIYIITHKVFNDKDIVKEGYKILYVGNNDDNNIRNYYLRDNKGINIAKKNSMYCELTGLYWIWKNSQESGIIGLVHYRRFFTTPKDFFLYSYFNMKPHILSLSEITNILKNYDIILPISKKSIHSVQYIYSYFHNACDLKHVRNAIKKLYPDYLSTYDREMKGHAYYYANMMVCNREILNKYSEWLFDILFEVEQNLDMSQYTDKYQKRVFGFLSERLIQVWVKYNRLRIKEMPIFNIEVRDNNIFEDNIERIKRFRNKYKM